MVGYVQLSACSGTCGNRVSFYAFYVSVPIRIPTDRSPVHAAASNLTFTKWERNLSQEVLYEGRRYAKYFNFLVVEEIYENCCFKVVCIHDRCLGKLKVLQAFSSHFFLTLLSSWCFVPITNTRIATLPFRWLSCSKKNRESIVPLVICACTSFLIRKENEEGKADVSKWRRWQDMEEVT